MRITRAIKNRISAKDKGIAARATFAVFFLFLYFPMFAIPDRNGYAALGIFIPLSICLAFVWLIGRVHVRMAIAALVLALFIVMTFGLTGAQQTSDGIKTGGWGQGGEHFVNIQLTEQGEPRPGVPVIHAQVTESDLYRLNPVDDVVCKYRTVSLFGWHLWTAIDSVDSAPVIGIGSRNAKSVMTWLFMLMGAMPLVYMIAVIIYRRRRDRKRGLAANVGDELPERTAPVNKSS